MADESEQNLVRRLRSCDHLAFAEFVQLYGRQVFLCCKTIGLNAEEAEDVAGETFLAVWQGLPEFDGRSKLSTWLWSIAYHKAVDVFRRKHTSVPYNDNTEAITTIEAAVSHAEIAEDSELIWDAVMRLPKLWAIVVVLFYREDRSLAEIAEIMKIPENTVKTYLHRSRGKLKEYLAGVVEGNQNVNR